VSFRPERRDGFASIRDYALIGNKRTAALIAADGAIDWFCPTGFDEPSAFGALLDADAGSFTLAPAAPFTVERCYRSDTNVLQTTFRTDEGSVRVTDAMSLPLPQALDYNEIIRRVDGLSGHVPMRWRVRPRFGYGQRSGTHSRPAGVAVFTDGHHALAVAAHDAGQVRADADDGAVHGTFTCGPGDVAILALSSFDAGPLAFASKDELAERLEATGERWRRWIARMRYDGPWRAAVSRSMLALDLMVDDRSSAIIAAPTMGLPERLGGCRNYDYRYGWLRDGSLTLEAMLRVGFGEQVHASLAWMFRATEATHPWLRPLYGADGGGAIPFRTLDLAGYRHSPPVWLGNAAAAQLQLGSYGDVFDMVWQYVRQGNALLDEAGVRLAELADFLCRLWRRPDSGLWELPERRHFTQSKVACHLALRRAGQLAADGLIPAGGARRGEAAAEDIHDYVHRHCWSDRLRAYTRAAGSEELDAAVLLAARGGFPVDEPERLGSTVDAIREQLGAGGPLLYRYSGMQGREGAFLACSFWAVEALARCGRVDEGCVMMEQLLALASDVGLFSEELDPGTHEFLGNMPQALTHLALVNAADVCGKALSARSVS
jgi:GH15 family glucan-1,4-alpha-glucosidase